MDGRRLSIKLGGFIKTFLRERSVDGGRISTKFEGFYEKIHERCLWMEGVISMMFRRFFFAKWSDF